MRVPAIALLILGLCSCGGGAATPPSIGAPVMAPASTSTLSTSASSGVSTMSTTTSSTASSGGTVQTASLQSDPNPIYLAYSDHVAVYANGATGNATPIRTFTTNGLTTLITADYSKNIYLVDTKNVIHEYRPTASGSGGEIATYDINASVPASTSPYSILGIGVRWDGGIALALTRNTSTGAFEESDFSIFDPSNKTLSTVEKLPGSVLEAGNALAVDGSGAVLIGYNSSSASNPFAVRRWYPQPSGFQDQGDVVAYNRVGQFHSFPGFAVSGADQLFAAVLNELFENDSAPLPPPTALSSSPADPEDPQQAAFGPHDRLFVLEYEATIGGNIDQQVASFATPHSDQSPTRILTLPTASGRFPPSPVGIVVP
jgi:hypothetical protein